MFFGKMKAVTFSYDDGVTQDIRLIDLFNKYNVKATFNLNSDLLRKTGSLVREGVTVSHNKVSAASVRSLYAGHEIAAHSLTHPDLRALSEADVIREAEQDRLKLSELAGYEVVGMAYPYGGYDDRVVDILKNKTGIRYARTVNNTYDFSVQKDWLRFNPSVYHVMEADKMFALGEKFVNLKAETPQIFYIWGHSYEFDIHNTWDKMEEFLKLISNRDDIFYGTNEAVFRCVGL